MHTSIELSYITQFKSADFFLSVSQGGVLFYVPCIQNILNVKFCYERSVYGHYLTYLLNFILTTLGILNEMQNNNLDNNHKHKK